MGRSWPQLLLMVAMIATAEGECIHPAYTYGAVTCAIAGGASCVCTGIGCVVASICGVATGGTLIIRKLTCESEVEDINFNMLIGTNTSFDNMTTILTILFTEKNTTSTPLYFQFNTTSNTSAFAVIPTSYLTTYTKTMTTNVPASNTTASATNTTTAASTKTIDVKTLREMAAKEYGLEVDRIGFSFKGSKLKDDDNLMFKQILDNKPDEEADDKSEAEDTTLSELT